MAAPQIASLPHPPPDTFDMSVATPPSPDQSEALRISNAIDEDLKVRIVQQRLFVRGYLLALLHRAERPVVGFQEPETNNLYDPMLPC